MQIELDTLNRVLELGGHLAKPLDDAPHDPLLVIPTGCKIENLSAFYLPRYIRQTVKLQAAKSFIEYVNRFKQTTTVIFAQTGDPPVSVVAVFDYHSPGPGNAADRCAHLARFSLQATPEWKTWLAADRQKMSQLDFALWLEENAGLLEAPGGAELLELVQSLHGHLDARFNQTFRLKDGAQKLAYDEDVVIRGTAGVTSKPGELELPAFLQAKLTPYEGNPPQRISARLKVRLENRRLVLWFETVMLPRITRECVDLTLAEIEAGTGLTPWLGTHA